MKLSAARRCLVFATLGVLLAACGSGGRALVKGDAPTWQIDAGFFAASAGFPTWAATNDSIVAFSSPALERPEIRSRLVAVRPPDATIIDLAIPSGQEKVFNPLDVLGGSKVATLVGVECAAPPTEAKPMCEPGELAVFTVDPHSKAARPVPVADDLKVLHVQNVQYRQRTATGWRVILGTIEDPRASEGYGTATINVSADAVSLVGTTRTRSAKYCFTSGATYRLNKAGGPTVESEATLSLTRLPTSSNTEENVALPSGMKVTYGGAAVQLACDADHAYLTNAQPVPGKADPHVYRLSGTAWDDMPSLVPAGATMAMSALSDARGVVLEWSQPNAGVIITALQAGGNKAHSIRATSGEMMHWQGDTGTVLLAPTPPMGASPSAGATVVLEQLKVWED